MTRPNANRPQIVTLIPARPFDRLFQTGSVTKVQHILSSGFTVLLVPVRQQSYRRLQSFYAVHLDPVIVLAEAFSFPEGKMAAIEAILCSQQSHINSL